MVRSGRAAGGVYGASAGFDRNGRFVVKSFDLVIKLVNPILLIVDFFLNYKGNQKKIRLPIRSHPNSTKILTPLFQSILLPGPPPVETVVDSKPEQECNHCQRVLYMSFVWYQRAESRRMLKHKLKHLCKRYFEVSPTKVIDHPSMFSTDVTA
jgi:hypothetical protein